MDSDKFFHKTVDHKLFEINCLRINRPYKFFSPNHSYVNTQCCLIHGDYNHFQCLFAHHLKTGDQELEDSFLEFLFQDLCFLEFGQVVWVFAVIIVRDVFVVSSGD